MSTTKFFYAFTNNLTGQYEECEGYRILCHSQGFNPHIHLESESDLEKVPFVATTLFKKSNALYEQLLRVHPDRLAKWTVSSSTSGDPSIVGRTSDDVLKLTKTIIQDLNVFDHNYGYDCVFFPTPDVMRLFQSTNIHGKQTESYIGNMLGLFRFNDNAVFLLKKEDNGNSFYVDLEQFVAFLKEHDNKNDRLILRGSTPLLYQSVQKLSGEFPPFHLGSNTFVHTGGGGWDGHKGAVSIGKQIARKDFVKEVSDYLDIPESNFYDTYSFTENSSPITGHYSSSFEDYLFHVPDNCRVLIRDVKTFDVIHEEGGKGFIEVLNADGTDAFAGAAILVDDMAEIVSEEKCPDCGKQGMTLRVLGRVTGSEAKGCGATLKVGSETK